MFRFSTSNGKSISFSKFKSKCRLSTYTALTLFSLNVGAVTGVGEYRFGPDVAENLACEVAEENAKQDALVRYNGQFVEAVIEENCLNELFTIPPYTTTTKIPWTYSRILNTCTTIW